MYGNLMKNIGYISCFGLLIANSVFGVTLPDLAPPKVQLVDEFGVNLMTGQVTHQLETVSIGGALGLAHTISSYTNNFSMTGYYGYQDKFYGKGRVIVLKNQGGVFLDAISVSDFDGTSNFSVMVNNQVQRADSQILSGYIYVAMGDTRNILERKADGFVYWTKPDGTVSKYEGGPNTYPSSIGLLLQVSYPNGFTVSVDWIGRKITTNTGFALKYIHQFDEVDRYMDASKPTLTTTQIPPVVPEAWASFNPKYIQAINTAKENCLTQTCTGEWPKAEFDWPAGMPRTIYLGDSTFRVIDAMGSETKYFFRGYDLAYDEHGVRVPWKTPNTEFSPRLIGLKSATSNSQDRQYVYQNAIQQNAYTGFGGAYYEVSLVETGGKIRSAKLHNEDNLYEIGSENYTTLKNLGYGNVRSAIPSTDRPGTISYAELIDGKLDYEPTWRNFLKTYTYHSGDKEVYEYDTRGNLNKVTKNGTWTSGDYPTSCSESTRKYCNKPNWTSDAKNNKTVYTYHPESGQVATVTYPANKNGLIAQTRYEYESRQAYYYQASGSKGYGSPIWLKAAEKYCTNSNYVGSSCQAGDEVVVRFEYINDNLLMTGKTVFSQKENKTFRTCYEYDSYGNQIGETQPNANLTSCN